MLTEPNDYGTLSRRVDLHKEVILATIDSPISSVIIKLKSSGFAHQFYLAVQGRQLTESDEYQWTGTHQLALVVSITASVVLN